MQEFKKQPDIVCISQPGSRRGIILYAAEKSTAERRQRIQYRPHFHDIQLVLFVVVISGIYNSQSRYAVLSPEFSFPFLF